MDLLEEIITLPDGRAMEVACLGDPEGTLVLFHHGTPGSTRLLPFYAGLLEHANLFLVSTSRAGYGGSTRHEGRDVAQVVEDSRAVLDHYRLGSYVAFGHSGGGPHALACAALDAGRCSGALSLAGPAPYGEDFDWTEGMAPENVEEFHLALEGGEPYLAMLAEARAQFAAATADTVIAMFGELLPPVDAAALSSENDRSVFAASLVHAFQSGYWGFHDDDQAFLAPWGFDVSRIEVPVDVWFGDLDAMVPPTHGEWLSQRIPGATRRFAPGEGHVSIVSGQSRALAEDLADLAR